MSQLTNIFIMSLKALFLNCTLKKSPEVSHTKALIDKAAELFQDLGVDSEVIRIVDHNIAFGVSSDEGGDDEWPQILEKIKAVSYTHLTLPTKRIV